MTIRPRSKLGDRRARPRFEVVGPLWGSLEAVEPVPLRNVGQGGVLLEARFSLPVDTVHRLRLASDGRTSDLQARVRHVTTNHVDRHYLIGLEFLPLSPGAADHLDRVISSNTAPAAVSGLDASPP
jgi:hypothetical protein